MKNLIIILILLAILLVSGCETSQVISENSKSKDFSYQLNNIKFDSRYTIKHRAEYVSAGGNRILNVFYEIYNDEPISCTGTYTTAMSDGTTVFECDLQKLKSRTYNCPNYRTQKDIYNDIKDLQPTNSYESEGKQCYYDNLSLRCKIVCFDKDNRIVTYVYYGGYEKLEWNILGYDLIERPCH